MSKIEQGIEYLKEELELIKSMKIKLGFSFTPEQKAKLAGYSQAIIDLEEWLKRKVTNV